MSALCLCLCLCLPCQPVGAASPSQPDCSVSPASQAAMQPTRLFPASGKPRPVQPCQPAGSLGKVQGSPRLPDRSYRLSSSPATGVAAHPSPAAPGAVLPCLAECEGAQCCSQLTCHPCCAAWLGLQEHPAAHRLQDHPAAHPSPSTSYTSPATLAVLPCPMCVQEHLAAQRHCVQL